jgi:hypothetical protein
MATVTHAVTTPDTGNTPNPSGVFTPSVGDLLIVFVAKEASVAMVSADLTSSIGGFGFSLVGSTRLYQASSAIFGVFVSNTLVSSATSQTVQIESGSDAGAGSNISVYRVSGMTRVNSAAIRQSSGQSNQTGGTTPAPAFGVAALTGNCCLGAIANATNPAGLTQPGSWSEGADTGYTTGQVNGIQTCFRNSGETGTTITWGSTSASAFASIIVELDTSVPPAGTANALLVF